MSIRRRKLVYGLLVPTGLLLVGLGIAPFVLEGPERAVPTVHHCGSPASVDTDRPLRVLSINLAHGRAEAFSHLLLSAETTRAHLDRVGEVLVREAPDVVALQEAEGRSWSGGGFDHVEHVTRAGGLSCYLLGRHVEGLGVGYGTALASGLPLVDPLSIRLPGSWPTWSKGFVVAAVAWPGRPERSVDVGSVHLDFISASARERQAQALVEILDRRGRPPIILGDLNCDAREETLRILCDRLDLIAYRPEEPLVTFPSTDDRIDWILIPRGYRFLRYQTLEDPISDHRAVIAEIAAPDGSGRPRR